MIARPPANIEELRRDYGDFRLHLTADGNLSSSWDISIRGEVKLPEPLPLGWDTDVKVRRVIFHYRAAPMLQAVFEQIHAEGLWPELKTFDGAYNFRAQRGSQKPSLHCWALAIDLNAATNPLGGESTQHPRVVEIFGAHGFHWGGRWLRRDPMHWSWSTGF